MRHLALCLAAILLSANSGLGQHKKARQNISISGTVSGVSATVALSGALSGSTTTDGLGNYAFLHLVNGTYVVTPSHSGYTFSPSSATVVIGGNRSVSGINFAASSNAPPPPQITSFAANPGSIVSGGSSSLSWTTTAAGTCSIDQGIGPVACQGSAAVQPAATTSYQLTASSAYGSDSRSQTVTVSSVSAQAWHEVYWSPLFNNVPLTGMPWSALTHITHVNSEISNSNNGTLNYYCNGSANCSFSTVSADAANVIGQAHSNGVQACMQIASGSGNWATVTNSANLPNLVNNTMTLMNLGYDCLSIDWEGVAPYSQTQMIAMADALKARIGSKALNYTIVPNNFSSAQLFANLQSHVDKFDVMTFDFSTSSPPTKFNSPINGLFAFPSATEGFESLEWNYQDLVTRGMPASKLNFGFEANGYIENGATAPYQNVSISASFISYHQIVSSYPGQASSPNRDSTSQMPWFSPNGSSWINYDDPTSIAAKAAWANSKGQGVGIFDWEASGDYVGGGHPLIAAMGSQ